MTGGTRSTAALLRACLGRAIEGQDRSSFEIHVLGPELKGFGNTRACAVQKLREQSMLAVHEREYSSDFIDREHDRQVPLSARAADLRHPRQLFSQHLAVEKEERRKRLLVSRCRQVALVRKPGEKRLDLRSAQCLRMAQAIESNKHAYPVYVRLPGAYAIVKITNTFAEPVEQLDRLKGSDLPRFSGPIVS